MTDGPTDGRTDGRTDRPSYRDAFLTDASKNEIVALSRIVVFSAGLHWVSIWATVMVFWIGEVVGWHPVCIGVVYGPQ